MLDTLDISASALQAQRTRLDTIAQNIANLNTTRNARGDGPYRRKVAVFMPGRADDASRPGVHVQVKEDPSVRMVHDQQHPHRDAQNMVRYPKIDLPVEFANALEASRAYEANVTTMEVTKAMINASLRLLA